MMRVALLLCFAAIVAGCSESSTSPSSVSTTTNIAGTWSGTMVSSNNATAQLRIVLSQSNADVTGTWNSPSVAWTGQISGTVTGSSFVGQLAFSGTVADGTVCTGAANVTGPVSTSALTWSSASGVVGGACPAPLPVGLRIDVQRP